MIKNLYPDTKGTGARVSSSTRLVTWYRSIMPRKVILALKDTLLKLEVKIRPINK